MYSIKFFDFNDVLIASHTIIADYLLFDRTDAENYCKMIAKSYPNVSRWYVYEIQGRLLLDGKIE